MINNIFQRHSIFNFFNNKIFFRPIWNVTFCKNIFIFWYSNNITNFKFNIFSIFFFTRINICSWFYINSFILIVQCYVLLYLFSILCNLSIYTFSDIEVIYSWVLFFNVLMNLSAITIFPSYALNTFINHYLTKTISLNYCKIQCPYLPIFYLVCGLIHLKNFEKR